MGNKIVDHSDIVGASPVGAAPTTSSFSMERLASMDWAKTTARRDEKHLSFEIWYIFYQRFDGMQLSIHSNGKQKQYISILSSLNNLIDISILTQLYPERCSSILNTL